MISSIIHKNKRCKKALLWFLTVSFLILIAIMANIYAHGAVTAINKADAILVLGAGQWNGIPSPIFQARLDYAQELYDAGYAHFIIITGGKTPRHTFSDSYVGKEYLAKRGVDQDRIFTENYSRTTWQNLNEARLIMQDHGIRSSLLVSHDFHMMRAERMSQDLDMLTFATPVKTKNQLSKLRYALREIAMYGVYMLFQI